MEAPRPLVYRYRTVVGYLLAYSRTFAHASTENSIIITEQNRHTMTAQNEMQRLLISNARSFDEYVQDVD